MLTLSRGVEPFWMNDMDAASLGDRGQRLGGGIQRQRRGGDHGRWSAPASPRGIAIYYHAPERTISVPKSPVRGNRRAGGHNSLTRVRPKPVLMAGGYAQFTYAFNYWGPTGVNRDTYVYVRKLPELDGSSNVWMVRER